MRSGGGVGEKVPLTNVAPGMGLFDFEQFTYAANTPKSKAATLHRRSGPEDIICQTATAEPSRTTSSQAVLPSISQLSAPTVLSDFTRRASIRAAVPSGESVTKRRTPVGTRWNEAMRRVPKSARFESTAWPDELLKAMPKRPDSLP